MVDSVLCRKLGGETSNICLFAPLGKWSDLTFAFFEMGWNHQPENDSAIGGGFQISCCFHPFTSGNDLSWLIRITVTVTTRRQAAGSRQDTNQSWQLLGALVRVLLIEAHSIHGTHVIYSYRLSAQKAAEFIKVKTAWICFDPNAPAIDLFPIFLCFSTLLLEHVLVFSTLTFGGQI